MSDGVVWRGGGGQPGYYKCGQKKARNVDPFGRSPDLLSGDHLCCRHSKHTAEHTYKARSGSPSRLPKREPRSLLASLPSSYETSSGKHCTGAANPTAQQAQSATRCRPANRSFPL